MNLHKLYLTENECYKIGTKRPIKGILVHSTGVNNPYLKRYVGPNDGLLGENKYGNHWNQLRPDGKQVCVNAFIGKLADGTVATYQTLPWEYKSWHSGTGKLGSAKNANNNGYLGFEICEDGLTDKTYFNAIYKEAVELVAYLCKTYSLDPMEDGVVICHSEGHARGIASNHADVMHWWPKFGKNMDTFRSDVAKQMKKNTTASTQKEKYYVRKSWKDASSQLGVYTSLSTAKKNCKPGYSVFDSSGIEVYSNEEKIDVIYQAYSKKKWWSKITNYNLKNSSGYAGVEKYPIQCLKVHLSKGDIQYRVHTIGGKWLNWITNDSNPIASMSYAGIYGKNIDMIQIRLVGAAAEDYDVYYRVSTTGSTGYLNWIKGISGSGEMSYAGIANNSIDKIQIYIQHK